MVGEMAACSCGNFGRAEYRHERGCAVYRGWLGRIRPEWVGPVGAAASEQGREMPRVAGKFSVGDAVRTRGGLSARVICVDRKDETFPMVAAYSGEHGTEGISFHTAGGRCYPDRESLGDLLPSPRRAVVWVRGRFDKHGCHWRTMDSPDGFDFDVDTFQIRVEIEDGRLDDIGGRRLDDIGGRRLDDIGGRR
jgi:hypothetical protein